MDFFGSIFRFSLEELPFVIISVVIAFTVHEFAHAYTAWKFGDPTARNQGRLTLNPVKHIDPIGMLLIVIAGVGWARPVPVNRYHFKNPRLAGVLVSIAGPVSNLLLAAIGAFLYFLLLSLGVLDGAGDILMRLLNQFVYFNVLLFVFNLLPIPPLDGYRIIEDLVPVHTRAKMTQYEQYGTLIFLILVITPLGQYTIYPLLNTFVPGIISGLGQLFGPLFL